MPQLLLALDQGTTSSRSILFSMKGAQVAVAQRELRQIYPRAGEVEHDPADIWETQLATAREVLAKAGVEARDVAAIGITNQRETTLLWERATGKPVYNAIVWQDRRTAGQLGSASRSEMTIREKTGLVVDPYFSASKLRWLLDHVPGVRARAERGELAFGTVDTWLLWNLTGGRVHATDVSNASRTMLYDIHKCAWDDYLLALFDVPRAVLPEVRDSAGVFGETMLLGDRAIPITGIAGDQQAALFGQNCITPGLAKNTYGTGCFMLLNTGEKATESKNKLLTTIAWRLGGGGGGGGAKTVYALEGSVFIGGAVVQWLRDGLGIIQSAEEIEALASSVPDSGGVTLVPAFAGLGAPHWSPHARGIITGLTRGSTKAHIARAALEAIAFQVADLLTAMTEDAAGPIVELRVDGGAARNNLLMQIQADLLQIPVLRPAVTETTALGAAFLAALGAGVVKSPAELGHLWKVERTFVPGDRPDVRAWNDAVTLARAERGGHTRELRLPIKNEPRS